jgi:hypothetical protein
MSDDTLLPLSPPTLHRKGSGANGRAGLTVDLRVMLLFRDLTERAES